ncbi:uncharacterized protein [Aegilops tauschii subsp. strangulata]|uniref:uncharacterized protein n=2 Tax=Triticinae TaxID=1648030 RepID=UPI003CC891F1
MGKASRAKKAKAQEHPCPRCGLNLVEAKTTLGHDDIACAAHKLKVQGEPRPWGNSRFSFACAVCRRFLHGVVTACSGADIADGSQISEPALLNRPQGSSSEIQQAGAWMAYHALSELKPGVKNWNVCVHVSHLWEYRGGTDTGPVQHVDMVLVNNKIHGVACHTIVEAVADIQDGFLEFVYDPIPFLDLAAYVGENKRFVHQLLKFIAKISEHPNGKVLLWKMGIARVLNKLLKNCSNASYLEDKAISERGAYRSDQLMLKWRIPLFRCLASIFSAQPSGKEQTAIEESSDNASVEECSSIMHHLLVLCQALPIFLDRIFNPVLAIILSVTFVLAFGEVVPQAICTRYGLAVGASFVWLVRIVMFIAYPIAYPIGKVNQQSHITQ